MSPRLPSSLKWLIDKRARLDAEIRKTRLSLENAKQLIVELSKLEEDLASVDRTLRLHEIKVDVENIKPLRSHYVRIKLPRGELTRSILLCLRLRDGLPATMGEIAEFIEARHSDLNVSAASRKVFRRSVHDRLKCLYHEGRLKRHHAPSSTSEGVWSLADD